MTQVGLGDSAIGEAREQCNDKIVMPCDSEEFLAAEGFSPSGLCDRLHCGNSFCSPGETTCRIESSTTPFNIRVMFGPAVREESPEDNLGMCLKYEQQPCVS
ncbi:Protein-glutamate methylesterase/protein-glutamine glutaminase 3 [Frankliniella fusca]|uniref:Protein-glutamate methylesterase/protein-glutamine glutaminase 3 n=1 Tax=Frankliniella fusca TaxID=407009 RepID=A0AAE1H7E9_9NEOP|nr:Protein-glutamate methylesterase/protein-glutamine glutaminase 3 [Frankliniella fusca]